MDITLQIKKIKEINAAKPLFVVPGYQRGYRWTVKEVERLLNDIPTVTSTDGNYNYCLQPIVVREVENTRYQNPDGSIPEKVLELIDGQQRLTTLFIIQKIVGEQFGTMLDPGYSIEYVTREGSRDYLDNIRAISHDDDNPTSQDFYFMSEAAKLVREKIADLTPPELFQLSARITEQLEVIWYEIRGISDGEAIDLFERLNIGKIPLTNSELVKALFLREAAGQLANDRAEEISLLWDQIEIQLNDEPFWGFLTANSTKDYEPRIDLILDLMARDDEDSIGDQYHTFFHFNKRLENGEDISQIWREIYETYLDLLGWYRNPDNALFHLVGYLMGSKLMTLPEVYRLIFEKDSENSSNTMKRKIGAKQFKKKLVEKIIDLIYDKISGENKPSRELMTVEKLDLIADEDNLIGNYSYLDDSAEGGKYFIHLVLLLYNMIGEMDADEHNRQFPLARHLKERWTLEHIHARKSANLVHNDQIKAWLDFHIPAVEDLFGREPEKELSLPDLLPLMRELREDVKPGQKTKDARERYATIYEDVWPLFSTDNEINDISNLTLLEQKDNSALSNSVFEVKRQRISAKDAEGCYIPWGTRRVFFKNFKGADASQSHFWSPLDRKKYVKEISQTLKKLLLI